MLDVDGARMAGLDPDRLRRALALCASWTEEGVVPGAAALVARGGAGGELLIAGECYAGRADPRDGRPVAPDTLFSLASITKPVTATALLLLVERGLVGLDEPVYRLLPEFLDAAGDSPFDRRHVLVRHLVTHVSGLPGFSPENLALRQRQAPLEDFVRSFGAQPLLFEPGTAYLYSNCAILLAAELVGRLLVGKAGQRVAQPCVGTYHSFVAAEVLGSLALKSCLFRPPAEVWDRIAWVQDTGQEGTDYEMSNSAYYRGLGIPWGGLFSTARDLARFVGLFLPSAAGRWRADDGSLRHLLSGPTVAAMTSIQVRVPPASPDVAPELRDPAAATLPEGPLVEWGLGWGVKGQKSGHASGDLTSATTFGHSGASGTTCWADPARNVLTVLLANRTLVSGWTLERPRQALFANATMAALAE